MRNSLNPIICQKSLFITAVLGFVTILYSACIVTHTPGFYSGYKRLPDLLKQKVYLLGATDSISEPSDSVLFSINAKHLVQKLKRLDMAILYFWSPNCSAKSCISVPAFIRFCTQNGYTPIIISEYYDFEQIDNQGVDLRQLLAINHCYYGTDYCNKYLYKFQKDLFSAYNLVYQSKYPHKYIYYDGNSISAQKPSALASYPWQ